MGENDYIIRAMTTVYPFNLHIGPLNITGYGIMMMAGFLMGGWLIDLNLKRRGLRHEYAADITVAAVVGGIFGAKLWFVAATGDWASLFSRGGLVWYGGFSAGPWWFCSTAGGSRCRFAGPSRSPPRRWPLPTRWAGSAASWWATTTGCPPPCPGAVQFPQGLPPTTAASLATNFGIPIPPGATPETLLAVHPTQVYESILMIAVFMFLWRLRKRSRGTGWLFGVYLVLAGTERFLVEFLRAKEDRLFGEFTLAQLTAIVMVTLGVVLVTRWKEQTLPPGEFLSSPASKKASDPRA